MIKFLIWGTGSMALRNYKIYKKIDSLKNVSVVGFIDNNSKKWGEKLDGVTIFSPNEIEDLEWDYICIFSSYKKQILKQLVKEMSVSEEKIKNIFYPYIEQLKNHYSTTDNDEIKNAIKKIEEDDSLNVYHFNPSYDEVWYEVFYDSIADLHYVLFEGKPLYLKRGFLFTKKGEKEYIRNIWYEQDLNSPHLYEEGEISVEEGDILVDCGVCEGNFSLHNIDKVSKLYLIECDADGWKHYNIHSRPIKIKLFIVISF